MRFITFASVILIASTLNGCSKTGTATPVTNSTSTSVRATQTSKKAQSADTNAVNDQKVEEQVNVNVGVKSDEVVSSKGSEVVIKAIENSEGKTVRFADPISTEAKNEALAIDSTSSGESKTGESSVVAVTQEHETQTEGEVYSKEDLEKTKAEAAEDSAVITTAKFELKGAVLGNIWGRGDSDVINRIEKLIKADRKGLNKEYIEKLLYSKLGKIIELKKSIEEAESKLETDHKTRVEIETLRAQLSKTRDNEKSELKKKIDALGQTLLTEYLIQSLVEKIKDAGKKLAEIYRNKADGLVHRQTHLDKVRAKQVEIAKFENWLEREKEYQANILKKEKFFTKVSTINEMTPKGMNQLAEIAEELDTAADKTVIMGKIKEDIVALKYAAERLESFVEDAKTNLPKLRTDLSKSLGKEKELILEQVEITHA